MKKFLIKVNGNQYEVEVEEIRDGSLPVYVPAAPAVSAPAAAPVQAAAPAPAAPVNEKKAVTGGTVGAVKVNAPMPGTILKVVASVGDKVKRGQVLVVLEAMKMENEIVAPSDGEVASINVDRGASVNAGDLLASIN
ncbi:MAG: biotin/lipoyl-binding protein [Clostridiaceae bacterium]|jgi:biotin carboxyl carrier protein|nr:biotin/lipoyl-binding protein [Clostridiaceae bacterium]